MRRHYCPPDVKTVEALDKEIAELEHKYLLAIARKQRVMQHSVPGLAAFEAAMTERTAVLLAIAKVNKDAPLLAGLPLLEMKANMAVARNPQTENIARAVTPEIRQMSRLYPYVEPTPEVQQMAVRRVFRSVTPSKPEPPSSGK